MPVRGILRDSVVRGSASAKHAPIYVDSDDNKLKFIPAGTGTTEVELLDGTTDQTLTDKTLTANNTHTAHTDKFLNITNTQSSTNGSTSYEPLLMTTTLSGAGQVGGRAKFLLEVSNVALGGWANALKAEIDFNTSGSVTGLGSAFVAEMTLPAATLSAGTYGVIEAELNCPASWAGTVPVSFLYLSAQGSTVDNFHDNGYLMDIAGLGSATSGEIFQANTAADATHALRIRIDGVAYYIMLTNQGA
jgi:hypothetical protein